MLVKFLGIAFLLLVIFGVIAYASGWIQISPRQDSTTIEMKTGEMKEAAEKAVDKTKELIEKAGDKLKELGGNDSEGVKSDVHEVDSIDNDEVQSFEKIETP